MKTIKKNVTVTTITADGVKVVDNKTIIETLPTATTTAHVTDKNAEKIYRAIYPDINARVFITSVTTSTVCYEMDIDTFISHAKAIEV